MPGRRRLGGALGKRNPITWEISLVRMGLLFGFYLGCCVLIGGPSEETVELGFYVLAIASAVALVTGTFRIEGHDIWTTMVTMSIPLPCRIEIGRDGVLIRQGFRRRFLAYREIRSARAFGSVVEVRLRDDSSRELSASEPWLPWPAERFEIERSSAKGFAIALAEWIGKGIERSQRSFDVDPASYQAFRRSGRAPQAWREAIRRAVSDGYRSEGFFLETAEAVLDDPGADDEARLGAALALVDGDPGDGRRRVRIAANASADPALRRALSAAAMGNPEQAAAALDKRASGAQVNK